MSTSFGDANAERDMAYTPGQIAIIERVTQQALNNMGAPDGTVTLDLRKFVVEILSVATEIGLLPTQRPRKKDGMVIRPPEQESAQAFIDLYQPYWNNLFTCLNEGTPDG